MIKKILLSLGLFLLVPSFSSAVFTSHPIGVYTPSVGRSSINLSVAVNGNVSSEEDSLERFVFSPFTTLLFFWDINSKPFLLFSECDSSTRYGGELLYYYFCDSIPNGNFAGMNNCQSPQLIDYDYLSKFMSSVNSSDNWSYQLEYGNNQRWSFDLCFSSSLEGKSLCFGASSTVSNSWCNIHQRDFTNPDGVYGGINGYLPFTGDGLTDLNYDFFTIPDSFIGVSPFKGGPIEDGYDIGQNFYTNGQIVEGYEYLGLDIGYCYGGFPIDDIFEPNQTIDDFTGYQFGIGATVWDLYNLYSGAYSTPKQFFQQMLYAYTNGQINRFKTEPKALIMFVQQYVSGRDRGRLNVGFYDLWDYCNLKFDNVDLNAQYTGHNQTPINGYNQKQASDSNLGGFQLTGNNAFTTIIGTGGSGNLTASEFFGSLTSRFQNGLGIVNTNYVGMIPTYILMFMFALIFIRLISH